MKKQVFTLRDGWIWWLLAAASALVTVLAIRASPGAEAELAILGLVDAVILGLVALHYVQRLDWVNTWNDAWKTTTDVAVLVDHDAQKKFSPIELYPGVERVITEAVSWWASRSTDALDAARRRTKMHDALAGATVHVVGEPPSVKYLGKVAGYQDGQVVVAMVQPDLVATLGLVRHEVSHLCLSALGIDPGSAGEAHHAIFKQTGYC